MIPLEQLQPGQQGMVYALRGGRHFVARLAALGFTPGALVTIVRNHIFGPLIVEVRGTQIAMGHGEARHVLVHQGTKEPINIPINPDAQIMTSLERLQPGQQGLVYALRGGQHFAARLAALGFTPGAPVTIVRNHGFGPLIVEVRGTQVAMGRGEARHILVHQKIEEVADVLVTP